jgi:hypothetical protein
MFETILLEMVSEKYLSIRSLKKGHNLSVAIKKVEI